MVIAARRIDVLEAAASELNKSSQRGGKIYVCQCNVRNEDDIQKLVTFALETMGRIDGLVNNAGGQVGAPLVRLSYPFTRFTRAFNPFFDPYLLIMARSVRQPGRKHQCPWVQGRRRDQLALVLHALQGDL